MVIDFFVHPSCPLGSTGWGYVHSLREYREDLLKVLESSELLILINGSNPDEMFGDIIPESNSVCSATCEFNDPFSLRGEIAPEDWKKFIDLISEHENESMRVHGAFFGHCISSFSAQLFAYLQTGEYFHNLGDYYANGKRTNKWTHQNSLLKEHERRGDFLSSNIKSGYVMHPPKRINIIRASDKLPYGNITFQLMDHETKVHGGSF